MVIDSKSEKNQTLKNPGRQIKCELTGYESTTKKDATREIRATKKNTKRMKNIRIPRRDRVQMTQVERTRTI